MGAWSSRSMDHTRYERAHNSALGHSYLSPKSGGCVTGPRPSTLMVYLLLRECSVSGYQQGYKRNISGASGQNAEEPSTSYSGARGTINH